MTQVPPGGPSLRLLLLDEATSSLDADNEAQARGLWFSPPENGGSFACRGSITNHACWWYCIPRVNGFSTHMHCAAACLMESPQMCF